MHLFDLTGDSPFDPFISLLEQVFPLQVAVHGQKPIHGSGMGFQPAVGKDVLDSNTSRLERLRHEQGSVALQRFFFRTHERDAVTGRILHNTLNSPLE